MMPDHEHLTAEVIKAIRTLIKQPLFCKCRYELAGHLAFMFR